MSHISLKSQENASEPSTVNYGRLQKNIDNNLCVAITNTSLHCNSIDFVSQVVFDLLFIFIMVIFELIN